MEDSWADPAVPAALQSLSSTDNLVILIGAGVSVSRGIPSWSALVRELIERACDSLPLSQTQKDALTTALADEASDPMAAAQLVTSLKGDQWISTEMRKLFSGNETEPIGSDYLTALAFTIVARSFASLSTTIITTNFDDLLERDINNSIGLKDEILMVPVYDTETFESAETHDGEGTTIEPVYHVHGIVASDGRQSELVLTLAQFAGIRDDAWSETVLSRVGDADTWLTVGMSLSDIHILRYITARSRRPKKSTTYSLIARHARVRHRGDKDVFFRLEQASKKAFHELGVTPLQFDHFSELAIFLDEVFLFTGEDALSSAVPIYPKRFNEYRDRVRQAEQKVDSQGVNRREKKISFELGKIASLLREFLVNECNSQEVIKVEYWEVEDSREHIVCCASSEGVKYQHSARPTVQLTSESPWAAAQALQSGIVTGIEREGDSRWKYFSGWPVRLWNEPYFGIQVGALVVSTTQVGAKSSIAKGDEFRDFFQGHANDFSKVLYKTARRGA